MRFRVTVRGEGVELRGFIERDETYQLMRLFADDIGDEGVLVIASEADADYNPFKEAEQRELHHFETEQILERIKAALANHPQCDVHDDDDPITCGWKAAVRDITKALEDRNG